MAKHKGRGIATIEYPTGMNQNGDPSQAWVKLKPDGRVDVFSGTVDIGQGSRTVHTQIVADTLGVPFDWVTNDNTNTDSSAVCTGSFASRGTFIGGNAVRFAAEQARERILDIASKELEIAPSDLDIVEGEVIAKGAPDRKIGIPDVAAAATWNYGELITGTGAALKPFADVNDDDGSVEIEPHSAISYAACVADVEVDDETGEVRVERMIQVYDVGRAINPMGLINQIHGGIMHGINKALTEELEYDPPTGVVVNANLDEYKLHMIDAMPEKIQVDYVEPYDVIGPFGAKGIGEPALLAASASINAGIYDAIGLRIDYQPMTPVRILNAIKAKPA